MSPAQVKETTKRIGDACHAITKRLDPGSTLQQEVVLPLLKQVQSLADCLGYLVDALPTKGTTANSEPSGA